MWQRLKLTLKRISTFEYNARYSRLAGDITCFESQLQKRIIDTKSDNLQWATQSLVLIDQAKKYLNEFKIDEGWKSLHTAKRYEFFGMDDQELLACAKSICKETQKLNEWRKDAILSLLVDKDGEVSIAPDPKVLFMAAELKDENYNNQYYMNRLSHTIFWLISGLLFLVLCSIVAYFSIFIHVYGDKFETDLNLTGYIIGVLLFGLLGALTSAIIFTRNMSKSSRIKELSSSQVVVMSKIFIGAGFSIFIFLLLRSSIADGIKLFNFSISKPLDYFAIAFASGFTERLAYKSMDLIIGKDKVEKTKTSDQQVV